MNYIFVVSGFTQQRYSVFGSGSHQVHKALLRWQCPELSVRLLEWKEDPEGHARRVAATTSFQDSIMVCAYSYGGGWWFKRFAEELFKLGRTIHVAVLCDPVRRHPFVLLRWRALTDQSLKLPANVLRVAHFYQTQTEPGGDNLVLAENTELVFSTELHVPHVKIDNSHAYLHAAVSEAERLFGG